MEVLLVDDDVTLLSSLRRGLRAEGIGTTEAHDGPTGLELAGNGRFDVIVLDVMLPGRNGYQVCADLRARGDDTPILMLTAKDGEWDEAEGLDTGADDWVTKPFSYPVLVARLRALARRHGGRDGQPFAVGDLHIDPGGRRVSLGARPVALTAREFDVLEFLARRPGLVLSKGQILDAVWDQAWDGDPNVVEVYVSRLRRALGAAVVETVRGVGYRLADAPTPPTTDVT